MAYESMFLVISGFSTVSTPACIHEGSAVHGTQPRHGFLSLQAVLGLKARGKPDGGESVAGRLPLMQCFGPCAVRLLGYNGGSVRGAFVPRRLAPGVVCGRL